MFASRFLQRTSYGFYQYIAIYFNTQWWFWINAVHRIHKFKELFNNLEIIQAICYSRWRLYLSTQYLWKGISNEWNLVFMQVMLNRELGRLCLVKDKLYLLHFKLLTEYTLKIQIQEKQNYIIKRCFHLFQMSSIMFTVFLYFWCCCFEKCMTELFNWLIYTYVLPHF
jgi:hypothetical protein